MAESSLLWILTTYKYWLIVPLAVVEGPVLMLLCGFFVRLGYLELIPAYLLLMVGDFIGDVMWYWIGRFGARSFIQRFGRFFSIQYEDFERFEQFFHRHQITILFISKITMGLGFPLATLMAAGATRVPFGLYALLNILGGFIWTGLLMTLGYFLGSAYNSVSSGLKEAFIVGMILIFMLMLRGFSKYLRKRFSRI